MPGTNLTRDEARTRAALLDVESYTVDLDLDPPGADHLRLHDRDPVHAAASPGASTFADLVGATVHEVTLNGRPLDPAECTPTTGSGSTTSQADNELRVVADCAYSHTGEGLHRFVDPADDRVYLYTQFEVPDARRVFTTFEQPDLKSVVHLHGDRARRTGWSSPTPRRPSPSPPATARAVWRFPATERMSTYVTAIVAGEYHEVHDTYAGKHGEIPLGHYCRQSLVEHLDADELVEVTKQGFEFFEDAFDFPYPFEQVRPALRAGVQHGRDGERRLRDAARRVPPPQPPGPPRSTSTAPTRSCTRWRTCGSATW